MDIIYLIEDSISGLKYIGSKKNWKGHDTYWGSPSCKSTKLKKFKIQEEWKNNFNLHKESFSFIILEKYKEIDHQLLLNKEREYQLKYNVLKRDDFINASIATHSGFCGNIYDGMSKEEKDKIITKRTNSLKNTLIKLGAYGRKLKYGRNLEENGMYGKNHTKESKQNMSIKQKENGKRYSIERKGINKKDWLGEEKYNNFIEKISTIAKTRVGEKNPFYGKKHTDETKKIIGKKLKGIKPINTKNIFIEGEIYNGLSDASKATGIKATTIWHRIHSKNKKYINFKYV